MKEMTFGASLVTNERSRQISDEGWTLQHDDKHSGGEIAMAAACYARQAATVPYDYMSAKAYQETPPPPDWPWEASWWKPRNPVRDLARAGALNAAEIDRRIRAAAFRYADALAETGFVRPE